MTTDEIRQVNKTARGRGFARALNVCSHFVATTCPKDRFILDFGAGPEALQARALTELGFNVTAWDIGANFREGVHNALALGCTYDVVIASNVLNVQPTFDCLMETIQQIVDLSDGGMAIMNYPREPRKLIGPNGKGMSERTMRLMLRTGWKRLGTVRHKNCTVFIGSDL